MKFQSLITAKRAGRNWLTTVEPEFLNLEARGV